MATIAEFDQLVKTCLQVHEAVQEVGTPEMQYIARILLFQVGQELARRQSEDEQAQRDQRRTARY